MSTDPDKDTVCPKSEKVVTGASFDEGDSCQEVSEKKRKKPPRSVRFPDENQLVTKYFEPANPWHDVPNTTRSQLAAEYLEGCRRHNTPPIDSVLQQIRELPENSIGGGNRAARLTLAECSLAGAAPVDALETVLRKVQFRRIEMQYCEVDDEGAEAVFDMIEYYESANVVSVSGPRQFGIRGWQAACRMIKKSAELSEISLCDSALCASHAPVLVRALRPHTCRLRALCLQRAELRGEPLLCLVIALKSNTSIRELRLPDNQLSVSDAQQLASLLKLNLHIQLLDLSNNDIQDAGTGHIADALVEQAAQTPPSAATSPLSPLHCPPGGREARLGLAFLVLWNNQLTRNCAPHLTKALRSSQSLCVLNIGRNALGADTVRALQCGSSLVSLGLQCARLGPGAARPLADLLKADTKLQRLDLRENRLGVAGLQAILTAMQENTTLTQIDLDDPAESSPLAGADEPEPAAARLARDIAALCRRNEPPASEPERRVLRKISLTCHTALPNKPPRSSEAARSRAVRLRSPAPSPAPSPAGSPIPHAHNSRFNVTRVTPDRESSAESTSPVPPRLAYGLAPSRFKVVQVVEPPDIQIHPASQKRPTSRFSVTRNTDAIYSLSPSASPTPSAGSPGVSPAPSLSPVPWMPPPGYTPKVMIGSPAVMTGSPTVMTGSPTMMTASPVMTSSSSTMVTGSPSVLTGSPPTLMSASPPVTSTHIFSGSPTVTGSPTVMTGSPTVMTGSPTVMTVSPTVLTGSPTVLTRSPTVMTGSPTGKTGSSIVTSSPAETILPAVTGSSAVMTAMLTFLPAVTGSSAVVPTMLTSSPTVISDSPAVLTDSPTELTSSSTVMPAPVTVELSIAVSNVPLTNTVSLATIVSRTVISESPLLKTTPGLQTVGILAAPMTEAPTSSMQTCAAGGPSLAQGSPISDLSMSAYGFVTSGIKAAMSPLLTAVPIVSQVSNENVSRGLTTDKIEQTGTFPGKDGTIQEVTNKMFDTNTVGSLKDDLNTRGTDKSADFITGTVAEDVEKSEAAEFSDVFNAVAGGASTDTLTGTIVSGTSLDTLSGTMDDSYKNIDTMESLTKVTDFEPSWSNINPITSLVSTDRSQLEPIFGSAAIPKNILESNVVPNSKFSISPIPGNFDISNEQCDKIKEIVKPVGSQSSIAATDKAPINIEADILTVLAEITEKVEPKVVELKDLTESKDIDKHKVEDILETITEVSQENTPITVLTDVSSNTGLIEKSINVTADEPVTEASQQIMTKENISKSIEPSDVSLFTELFNTENECRRLDVRSLTADKTHEIAIPFKETVKNKELDNVNLKCILEDDVGHTEIKPLLPKAAVVAEFDHASKLEYEPHKSVSHKISETKTSECVKNKTYSDAVKSDPKYMDKSEQLTHNEEISDSVVKTETKLVKNSVKVCDSDKLDVQIEVTVKKESVQDAKVHSDQNKDFVNLDDIIIKKEPRTMKQIQAITEDLGNLIQEMKDLSSKSRKVKSDCTVDIVSIETNTVPGNFNRDVVLKKNKSESSLDSPDLEVSRLMNKKLVGSPFCDSSSSLEVSGSSMESLNATEHHHATCHMIPKHVIIQESVESDSELDRRKDIALSMGSSIESASDVTPVNSGNYLNMSVSSNESVSPIIFGKKKKLHDSLSSLEASMSSLDSGRQEKVMVTSADSGIEYSLQHPSENKEDNSSNEGTLTHNSSLKETVKKTEQETLTSSPKRASSLLDVPALKTKGLDRMRKISWVAPSSSFHIPRVEPKVETEKIEKPSHLEKLLSLFQHPTSLFSRSQSDEEKKSASNTPPRKDSSLTSSFWSWGSTIEKDDKEDSSEATDSTLSERVQVSFVDESFSKKLDSKTPSTDTDNTLSEFQSFPTQTSAEKVTDTTDEDLVQKCLGLSLTDKAGSNGNSQRVSDTTDLNKPNDFNRNYVSNIHEDKSENNVVIDNDDKDEAKIEAIRPRSFAAVLKSSGSENYLDKQPSPDSGQSVDKLPSKVIRGIKENISPENTLTSSMTKTLVLELTETQTKNQPHNSVWEVPILDKKELKTDEVKTHSDLAPIATIDETCDEAADTTVNVKLEFIDDVKTDDNDVIDIDNLQKEVILERHSDRRSDLRKEMIIENTLERRSDLGIETIIESTSERRSNLRKEKHVLERHTGLQTDFKPDQAFTVKNTEQIINLKQEEDIEKNKELRTDSNEGEDILEINKELRPDKQEELKERKTYSKQGEKSSETDQKVTEVSKELEHIDLGKDALSYLIYESQDFRMDTEHAVSTHIEGSLAQELKEAEIKEMLDLSPELIIDEATDREVFTKEMKGMKSSPVIPERAKLKKSNSLENLSQREETAKSSPKTKTIAFKVPETQPRDIPRTKMRTLSGSSPKSLPESLNKPCPLAKLDSTLKKRKKISSLGKMAKDSLLALNMSEDEIAEHRRSYVTSAESLRSLESVSEDANSQSGTSVDSRCRSCLRTSQESLMSLDSITEDCRCGSDCEKGRPVR